MKAGVADEGVKRGRHICDSRVVLAQCPTAHVVPDGSPVRSHVVEVEGPRLVVLQVPDELSKYPRLIRVFYPPELLLHDCGGDDPNPGEVVEADLA